MKSIDVITTVAIDELVAESFLPPQRRDRPIYFTKKIRHLTAFAAALALTCTVNAAPKPSHDIVDTAVKAGSFNTLVAAVKAAGLVETLKGKGPFTVFAPTDEAFAKLPKGTVEMLLKPENKKQLTAILTYHVVPGRVMAANVMKLSNAKTVNGQRVDVTIVDKTVMIDKAKVTATDIKCSNGLIHVIDSVIMPSSDDIVDTAVKAGVFNTLVAAVQSADLVKTLKGDGPFTVFAPTDAAFAKLPEGTVESLLKPENKDQLIAILTYHVVPGRVFSNDALKAGSAKTIQGGKVYIKAADSGARVNNANLITLDIDTSNGVVHVIDAVLMPKKVEAKQASAGLQLTDLATSANVPM